MKRIEANVEALYNAREPTGSEIVDEVIDMLRKSKAIRVADMALLMDVDADDLQAAWRMLTGGSLRHFITRWRVHQALELIGKRIIEPWDDIVTRSEVTARLGEIAQRCGWQSERVMSHVFERYLGCSAPEYVAQRV